MKTMSGKIHAMNCFAQILLTLTALVSTAVAAELKYSVVPDFFDAKPGD